MEAQGQSPQRSKDPKVYITKKKPKTDSHGAFLTQDMPMITLLSPNSGAAGLY